MSCHCLILASMPSNLQVPTGIILGSQDEFCSLFEMCPHWVCSCNANPNFCTTRMTAVVMSSLLSFLQVDFHPHCLFSGKPHFATTFGQTVLAQTISHPSKVDFSWVPHWSKGDTVCFVQSIVCQVCHNKPWFGSK